MSRSSCGRGTGSRFTYSLFVSGVPLSSSGSLTIKTCPSSSPASHRTLVPSHFNAAPANMPTRAVQGCRRYARTRRRSWIPTTSRALATFSGGGSWAEPLWKTAPRRIPTEPVRFRASPSRFRPPPLVPGLLSFRARVILRTDGPPRPIPRLPVRGRVPPLPHSEPPLLFVLLGVGPGGARGSALMLIFSGSAASILGSPLVPAKR
jgi:hypothetical protein